MEESTAKALPPMQDELEEEAHWIGVLAHEGVDPQAFTPLDADDNALDVMADSLLERLKLAVEEGDSIRDVAQRRRDMISQHEASELESVERRIRYIETKLRFLFPGLNLRGKKSKSYANGKVGTSLKGGGVVIDDPEKALAFAEECGIPVKVTKQVQKTPLAEYVKSTGDQGDLEEDGWTYREPQDEFYWKV
jgi:hypothetical protein